MEFLASDNGLLVDRLTLARETKSQPLFLDTCDTPNKKKKKKKDLKHFTHFLPTF